MNTDEQGWMNQLSERVIGCAFEVSNQLGVGFLEKVYQRALVKELALQGIRSVAEQPVPVHYKGDVVGDYFIDILVENKLVVELKCVSGFLPEYTAQVLNYLRASGLPLALLLNFKPTRIQIKRLINDF